MSLPHITNFDGSRLMSPVELSSEKAVIHVLCFEHDSLDPQMVLKKQLLLGCEPGLFMVQGDYLIGTWREDHEADSALYFVYNWAVDKGAFMVHENAPYTYAVRLNHSLRVNTELIMSNYTRIRSYPSPLRGSPCWERKPLRSSHTLWNFKKSYDLFRGVYSRHLNAYIASNPQTAPSQNGCQHLESKTTS